jgi:hypothetical protein
VNNVFNNLFNIIEIFKEKDKSRGLVWSVIITWLNFPFLYWGVTSNNSLIITLGLLIAAIGTGFTLYFG